MATAIACPHRVPSQRALSGGRAAAAFMERQLPLLGDETGAPERGEPLLDRREAHREELRKLRHGSLISACPGARSARHVRPKKA